MEYIVMALFVGSLLMALVLLSTDMVADFLLERRRRKYERERLDLAYRKGWRK